MYFGGGKNVFLGQHYSLEVTVLSQRSRQLCDSNPDLGKPFLSVLGDPSSLPSAFLQNSVLLLYAARTTKSKDIGKGTSSFSSQFSLFSPSLPLRHCHVMFPVSCFLFLFSSSSFLWMLLALQNKLCNVQLFVLQ